jgi:hypothetical protein
MNISQLMISFGGSPVGIGPIDDLTRHDPALAEAIALFDAVEAQYGHLASVIRRMAAFWKPGPRGVEIVSALTMPCREHVSWINHHLVDGFGGQPKTYDEIMACWHAILNAHLTFNAALGADGPRVG